MVTLSVVPEGLRPPVRRWRVDRTAGRRTLIPLAGDPVSSHRTVEFGVLGTYLVSWVVVTAPVWLASPPEVHSALLVLVRGRVRCRRPRRGGAR